MNPIVIYTSKYGAAEKYAKWLAQALGCPAKSLQETGRADFTNHDTILYGGSLYVGSIAGFKGFLKKLQSPQGKKLVLFMVGMTDPAAAEIYDEVVQKNIPQGWENSFQPFALRGDLVFSQMGLLHKLLMAMPKSLAQKKPPEQRTAQDQFYIDSYGKDVFLATQEQIQPILNYIRGE